MFYRKFNYQLKDCNQFDNVIVTGVIIKYVVSEHYLELTCNYLFNFSKLNNKY